MKISVNWLKKYIVIDQDITELSRIIGAKLVEIEDVIDLGARYKGVVVAKVMSVETVEGSDHLHKVMLDDGGKVREANREDSGLVQVICGAPNVVAGKNIAWITPGSVVPETYGAKNEMVLEAKKIIGFISNGMIASPRELALYDEHLGILILDDDIKPGTSFAAAYELNDYILDIENKSLTQRPDCFGILGFAREVAGVLGQQFKSPEWLLDSKSFTKVAADVEVFIDDPSLSEKYQVAVVDNLQDIKGLSLSEKFYLSRVGVRPISPIVDVSNYLMMLTGQPTHTFDYQKVKAICEQQGLSSIRIGVRLARQGETLAVLGKKVLKLDPADMVIVAGDEPIDLAGALGGISTEVDATTTKILFEAATFNLYRLRQTQMRHGIFSEAATRMTKGVPKGLASPTLAKAIDRLFADSGIHSNFAVAVTESNQAQRPSIKVTSDWVNSKLGTDLTANQMAKLLSNVEFEGRVSGTNLTVVAPFWRNDVLEPIDIVEEVGRLYGYDNIPVALPIRTFQAVDISAYDKFRATIRHSLTQAGANEALNYTFVSDKLLGKAGQDPNNSYKVTNSISPNLQRYRQSLLPSLLADIHPNIKDNFNEFAIYEINKTHQIADGLNDEEVPVERESFGLVLTKKYAKTTSFFQAKRFLEFVGSKLNIQFSYQPLRAKLPETSVFEPRLAAEVMIDDQVIGYLGEINNSVATDLKLPEFVAGFELDLIKLFDFAQKYSKTLIEKSSKFPSIERDVCFEVESKTTFGQVDIALKKAVADFAYKLNFSPIDLFTDLATTKKRFTFRIKITSFDRTLTGAEATEIIDQISAKVVSQVKVQIV